MPRRKPVKAAKLEGNTGKRKRVEPARAPSGKIGKAKLPKKPARKAKPDPADDRQAQREAQIAERQAEIAAELALNAERMAAIRKAAAAELKRITPHVEKLGELSPLYKVALEDRCWCFACVHQLELMIWSEGPALLGRNRGGGVVKHPLFTELKGYRAALQKYDDMLGLAPGPRGRMATPDQETDEDPEGLLD